MFAVGNKVEACFGGRSAWYPGEVTAINEGGTSYAVNYDDGDVERAVKREHLRHRLGSEGSSRGGQGAIVNDGPATSSSTLARTLPAPSAAGAFDSSSDRTPTAKTEAATTIAALFTVGQKVEARFGGKAKWYGAVVKEAHDDGTYTLHYDDGDKESSVPEDLICPAPGPQLAGIFRSGQRVQGRFGGKNKFYNGTVLRDQGDGTYAVKYDDGDVENEVRHVRALHGAAATTDAPQVEVSFSASAPAAVDPLAAGLGRVAEEEGELSDDADMPVDKETETPTVNTTTIDSTTVRAAQTVGATTIALPTVAEAPNSDGSSTDLVGDASLKTRRREASRDEVSHVGPNAGEQGNATEIISNQVWDTETAPPSAFANAASVFDLSHGLGEDEPFSSSLSASTKAAKADMDNKNAATIADAAYIDNSSSKTTSTKDAQPTSMLVAVLGATSNASFDSSAATAPAEESAAGETTIGSQAAPVETIRETARVEPGAVDAPLEGPTGAKKEAGEANKRVETAEEANKRAAILAKAARSLVLLREAPTRWDLHRSQVHRSYASEAILRGEEIVQLKHALARAQAATANSDPHPQRADTATPVVQAAAAAAAETTAEAGATAFPSYLPPPPVPRGKTKMPLPLPPPPPPSSARGRIVRFLVEKGGLSAGGSSSRSHTCSSEQCEAFFGCPDLETLAENADAKVAAAVAAGVLTSPEPASTVLRALRRYALKQSAASNLLRLTFRCLFAFAKAEKRARAVEFEADGARKRRDATEAECNRKVNALTSKVNRLERELAEAHSTIAAHGLQKKPSSKSNTTTHATVAITTVAAKVATAAAFTAASPGRSTSSTSEESSSAVKREMESLRSMLRRRDAQVDELGRRVAQQAGLANQVAALTKALTRATVRERTLEKDLELAQRQLLTGLKDAQEEVASVKASCARRVSAADRSVSQQANRADQSNEARLAGQARYSATLAARRRDDPSSAEAQPAIRAHHGLLA